MYVIFIFHTGIQSKTKISQILAVSYLAASFYLVSFWFRILKNLWYLARINQTTIQGFLYMMSRQKRCLRGNNTVVPGVGKRISFRTSIYSPQWKIGNLSFWCCPLIQICEILPHPSPRLQTVLFAFFSFFYSFSL